MADLYRSEATALRARRDALRQEVDALRDQLARSAETRRSSYSKLRLRSSAFRSAPKAIRTSTTPWRLMHTAIAGGVALLAVAFAAQLASVSFFAKMSVLAGALVTVGWVAISAGRKRVSIALNRYRIELEQNRGQTRIDWDEVRTFEIDLSGDLSNMYGHRLTLEGHDGTKTTTTLLGHTKAELMALLRWAEWFRAHRSELLQLRENKPLLDE